MKRYLKQFICVLLFLTICINLTGCLENSKPADKASDDTMSTESGSLDGKSSSKKDINQEKSTYSATTADLVIKMYQYDGEYDLTKNSYAAYHQVFKDYVESHTDGRIFIEIYPDSTLGNVDSMPEQCHNGIVHIISGQNASIYTSYVPEFCIFEIPFSFSSEEVMREFLREKALDDLKAKLIDVYDLRLLSILPASFRWPITAKKPITDIFDMEGLNIRTSTGLLMEKTYDLLGANVYTTAFSEVLTSVQTGILDGWEGSIQTAYTSGYYEVTPYINLYPVLGNIPTVAINEKLFQTLSPEDQQILMAAASQADASFAGCLIGVNTTITKADMVSKGATIYQPSAESISNMKAATQEQAIKEAIDHYGVDKNYIDSILKTIADIEERLNNRKY